MSKTIRKTYFGDFSIGVVAIILSCLVGFLQLTSRRHFEHLFCQIPSEHCNAYYDSYFVGRNFISRKNQSG